MNIEPSKTSSSGRTWRRWITRLVIVAVVVTVALELFARFGLGLGDPPLMMADPEIEYLPQPSKSYRRMGHRITYNRWSMRSDDFRAEKTAANEFRLLVLGDSVVDAGHFVDQPDIATEIVKREWGCTSSRPVVVGNVSAGSWGPPNLLAYVKRFGWFDADAVVIVLSSHDAADAPTFGPMGVDAPEHKPLLALQEVCQRYLPRYLPRWLGGFTLDPPLTHAQIQRDREAAATALRELLHLAQATGARVVVLQHVERTEIQFGQGWGHDAIAKIVIDAGIERIELRPAFERAYWAGDDPYRNDLHPNARGQQLLADAILEWLGRNTAGQ